MKSFCHSSRVGGGRQWSWQSVLLKNWFRLLRRFTNSWLSASGNMLSIIATKYPSQTGHKNDCFQIITICNTCDQVCDAKCTNIILNTGVALNKENYIRQNIALIPILSMNMSTAMMNNNLSHRKCRKQIEWILVTSIVMTEICILSIADPALTDSRYWKVIPYPTQSYCVFNYFQSLG